MQNIIPEEYCYVLFVVEYYYCYYYIYYHYYCSYYCPKEYGEARFNVNTVVQIYKQANKYEYVWGCISDSPDLSVEIAR